MVGPTLLENFILDIDDINTENRTLAEKPNLNIRNLVTYPSLYETYYNDHLPLKSWFVNINSKWKFYVFDTSPSNKVIKGKDNWLFYNSNGDGDTLADYLGTNHYTRDDLEIIKTALTEKETFLRSSNKEFYVLICPNKSQIYSEYMPRYFIKQDNQSRTDILVDYLKANTNLGCI